MLEPVFESMLGYALDQLRPDLIFFAYIVLDFGCSFLPMGLSQASYSSLIGWAYALDQIGPMAQIMSFY